MTKESNRVIKSFNIGDIKATNVLRTKQRVRLSPGHYGTSTTYNVDLKKGKVKKGYNIPAKNL